MMLPDLVNISEAKVHDSKGLCAMNIIKILIEALQGCYVKDEGRPLGTGLQELVPNRCKRLQLRALVVSVTFKSRFINRQVTVQEVTKQEPSMRCRKLRGDVKTRFQPLTLGIPTVSDRIAQMAVVMMLESKLDAIFHTDSYGYRPSKSAHGAIDQARKRCWKYDWVLDLDIKGFFDNIDHDLLNKALERHTEDQWVIMYVNRWLTAPYQTKEGQQIPRDKGVPQGSVIGPLLANLFLHYVFDEWMRRTHAGIPFERYADDSICHCRSRSEAEVLKRSIQSRLANCGLELNETKTQIVYCKDSNRKQRHDKIAFDFLGYTFRPRRVKSRQGEFFTGFNPAISNKAKKRIGDKMREWKPRKWIRLNLQEIAEQINPIIRGWINYYGKYFPSELQRLLQGINTHLAHWARRKFRKFRYKITRSVYWLGHIARTHPNLFAHWHWGVKPTAG